MKRAAVTGATGFIGQALIPALRDSGWAVTAVARSAAAALALPAGVDVRVVGDLVTAQTLESALQDVSAVVHLAGKVHDRESDDEASYRMSNAEATERLARAATKAGVRRFIFTSTVKAVGSATPPGQRWNEGVVCSPADAYGRSKLEAERRLARVSAETGMEVVVLRLPLVYGPGVRANMGALLDAVLRGIPVPLGGVRNARSLLYRGNLVHAVVHCLEHRAPSGTYFITDGEPTSTEALVKKIAEHSGRAAALLPAPPQPLLRLAALAVGHPGAEQRLYGDLVIDASLIRAKLGWSPPYSLDQGLREMVYGAMGQVRWDVRRVCEAVLAAVAAMILSPALLFLAALVKATSPGPVLYWSDRVGLANTIFSMPKFRTMRINAPVVATHLLKDPEAYLTPIGGWMRRLSLDELPQLWSIVTGRLAFVGPRPALYNQDDLIALRTAKGVHRLTPGLTGWAQVNGRDELPIPVKVAYDEHYLQHRGLGFDAKILFMTVFKVAKAEGVAH